MGEENIPKSEMPTNKRSAIFPFIFGLASIICLTAVVFLAFSHLPSGGTFGEKWTFAIDKLGSDKLLLGLFVANCLFCIVGLVNIKHNEFPLLALSLNVFLFAIGIIVGIGSFGQTIIPTFGSGSPVWSPDSTKIAYISNQSNVNNRDIFIMNADGSNKRFLTTINWAQSLQWLPSGKIAVYYNTTMAQYMTIINLDGSNQNPSDVYNQIEDPLVSPDESKFAFQGKDGIYVMNADGSNLIKLTSERWYGSEFIWAPDSSKVAYINPDEELNIVNSDGSNPINLGVKPWHSGSFEWSPDGSRIAFDSWHEGGIFDIHLVDVNGDGEITLSINNLAESFFDPTWSPDGKKILFMGDNSGKSNIYVMDVDGSNVINLSKNDNGAGYPVWSPDGTKIAFESYRGEENEIYVMNADGSNRVAVTGH